MIWLLGGYMWLYVHRPFEVWTALGDVQIERGYMLLLMLLWLVWPNKGFVPNRLHAALALFSCALLATWVLSPYSAKPGCLEVVENYAKVAVFYVLVVTSVRDERGLRQLLLMFLAAVGLYVTHSLWEYLHGRVQYRMGTSRMTGVDTTYGDPNVFASTLLLTLSFLLPFWTERPRRISRLLLAGFALFLVGCLLLTGSRAGFAAMGGLVFLIMLSSMKSKATAVALGGVAAVAGVVLLGVLLPDDLRNRYLTLFDPSRGPANAQESAQGRVQGIVLGFRLFGESPLHGHGPGSFVYCTGKGLQPHNLYGQLLSEMGLVGAVGLLAVLVCFWRNAREARRAARGDPDVEASFAYAVSRAVGLNVLLLLVMGCAGHNLYRYNWQWYAAFGAIALHCIRLRGAAEAQASRFCEPLLNRFEPAPMLSAHG
jgi:O-antigen ligase